MKKTVADYIKEQKKILVSPIWGGEQVFHFLCMGHVQWAEALGFESYQATPVLRQIRGNSIRDEAHLDEIIREHRFCYDYFERELESLAGMLKDTELTGWKGGGCFGPLTVASDILGAERMLRAVVKEAGMVKKLTAYITGFMTELAERERDAGAEFFWIAEPVASLLAPKRFWEFSGMYLKQIYDAARVPSFLHVCGKTTAHTKYMENTGAEVLSIDSLSDIGECIRMVRPDTIIMGNVNPQTLRFGTAENVWMEVEYIINQCLGYPNFVLSTGCSIMDGTPDEQMQILFDAADARSEEWCKSWK